MLEVKIKSLGILAVLLVSQRKIGNIVGIWETDCLHWLLWCGTQHMRSIECQRNYHRAEQRCDAFQCSFKVPCMHACLPGGWEASWSRDKPTSHQHILKKQSMFWFSKVDTIKLSAFEVRSIQAAKSKKQFLSKEKKTLVGCGPFGNRELRLIKYFLHWLPSFPAFDLKKPFPACIAITFCGCLVA